MTFEFQDDGSIVVTEPEVIEEFRPDLFTKSPERPHAKEGERKCDMCPVRASIAVHGHDFCMQHYEEYYYKQPEAMLPFEFIPRDTAS